MTPKQQEAIIKALNNSNGLKALKREFDRSFVISIDAEENGGKVKIAFEEKDSGHSVMTIADVAAFLQIDRASVRRMTGERAQRRSHHPIPFVKIGGKMLRFSRPAVEAWWNELCKSKNGKSNTSALTLTKGKVKKS
jgi:predicted DNA-binding transcriptional regulator AlpA